MSLIRVLLTTCVAMPAVQLFAGASPTTRPAPTAATAPVTIGLGGSMFAVTAAETNRERVVFVLDQSGSLLNRGGRIPGQLEKAIRGLRPTQFFNIVFSRPEHFIAFAPEPVKATPDQIAKAVEFSQQYQASGSTNLIPAVDEAISERPDLVFMVTDGDLPDDHLILRKRIADGKSRSTAPWNVIVLVGDDGDVPETGKMLSKIAEDTGGLYRIIRDGELE